eukprot:3147110-Rhodomonas_salina.1
MRYVIRACYAMPGTDLAYRATRPDSPWPLPPCELSLLCYAKSGTDIAYRGSVRRGKLGRFRGRFHKRASACRICGGKC